MALKSFAVQMQALIDKAKADADTVVRSTLLKLDDKLVERSPVGDPEYWQDPPPPGYVGGRFKGNWQVSANAPESGETGRLDKDGDATKAANAGVISQAKPGLHYIVNNVPYAQRIEEGWSQRQAPVGVVALTVVEFKTMVDNAVNEVRQGTSAEEFAQGWSTYGL